MSSINGIAQVIGDEVAGLSYSEADGGNVFVAHLPKMPHRCVSVFSRPGPEASSLHPYDEPHYQIIFRSDASPQWAIDMAQAVYSCLHGKRNTTLPDGTYLVYCLVMQSSPVHLAPDESGRYRLSLNVKAEVLHTTVEREFNGDTFS
jgi:hypothetical protein